MREAFPLLGLTIWTDEISVKEVRASVKRQAVGRTEPLRAAYKKFGRGSLIQQAVELGLGEQRLKE